LSEVINHNFCLNRRGTEHESEQCLEQSSHTFHRSLQNQEEETAVYAVEDKLRRQLKSKTVTKIFIKIPILPNMPLEENRPHGHVAAR
jgi:hypothetical protein